MTTETETTTMIAPPWVAMMQAMADQAEAEHDEQEN